MSPNEVIVAVRRRNEILVVHRSPGNGGFWHLIAGPVEEGETPEEAAVRALSEIAKLSTTVAPLDFSFTHHEIQVDAFVADAPAGWEPALGRGHDQYIWCSPGYALKLLYWPEPREIVEMLP
ncbi:MAG: lipoyl(octanoyl) transferase [Gaiellaceae bacterium]|jgi:8-oxo-dGTP pyrophosphatase MutT (NUDIX family)|nr:lipoyl(octanoyl) transferase [Gaiellaceae bacterium]